MSAYTVKAVLILDSEGKRLVAKYYGSDFTTHKEQVAFEKDLVKKTQRINGSAEENELILLSVMNGFYEAVYRITRSRSADEFSKESGMLDRRSVIDNIDLVYLCVDELVDRGVILESDPSVLESRAALRGVESDVPLAEQTISQALQNARDQIARSLLTR